jgi:hypothetical protein
MKKKTIVKMPKQYRQLINGITACSKGALLASQGGG